MVPWGDRFQVRRAEKLRGGNAKWHTPETQSCTSARARGLTGENGSVQRGTSTPSQLPTLTRKESEKQHSVFQAHGPDVVSESLLDIGTSKRGIIIPEREGGQPDERSSELIIAGTYNQRENL